MPPTAGFAVLLELGLRQFHRPSQLGLSAAHDGRLSASFGKFYQIRYPSGSGSVVRGAHGEKRGPGTSIVAVGFVFNSSYSDMFDGRERFGVRSDHGKCRHGGARG